MVYFLLLLFMSFLRPILIFGKNISSTTTIRSTSSLYPLNSLSYTISRLQYLRYSSTMESSNINTTSSAEASSSALSSLLNRSPLHTYTRFVIPPFNKPFHKGGHGKVAIVGGSFEYTGAPYYSGIAALKTGADLVWIICSTNAGVPIKAYSPELIVHPILPDSRTTTPTFPSSTSSSSGTTTPTPSSVASPVSSSVEVNRALQSFRELVNRLDTVIIGPGLGRDPLTLETVEGIISICQERRIPLVMDGDGLYLLSVKPTLLYNYPLAILTPNVNEFRRLWEAVYTNGEVIPDSLVTASTRLIEKYSNNNDNNDIGILRKGERDSIIIRSHGKDTYDQVFGIGSPRRCGGQGDILAGSLGTFLAWGQRAALSLTEIRNTTSLLPTDLPSEGEIYAASARGAALLTRNAAKHAFAHHKRSMTTPDILQNIGVAFENLFPNTLYQVLPNEEEEEEKEHNE